MQSAASAAITLFLLGLCALLAGPAFDLPAFGRQGQLGPGALPRFVIIGTALFALASLAADLLPRKSRAAVLPTVSGAEASSSRILTIGGAVLALLGAYVLGRLDKLVESVIQGCSLRE